MSCPMGTGYKGSSSFTAHMTWENMCVLSQAVLTGFTSGLWGYVTLLTCISSPDLVKWERMSRNSSHAKMCAVPARATTTARRWQKRAHAHSLHMPCVLALKSWREERGEAFSVHVGNQTGQLCVGGVWLLCPLWAAGQRRRQPWGKGAEGGWPRALVWPTFFPIPCFC